VSRPALDVSSRALEVSGTQLAASGLAGQGIPPNHAEQYQVKEGA